MAVKNIAVSIDPRDFMKGDVVITKRTYAGAASSFKTKCTRCGEFFKTTYRRMGRLGTPRACEVRNIPQCSPCRSRYRKNRTPAPITDPSRLLPAHPQAGLLSQLELPACALA